MTERNHEAGSTLRLAVGLALVSAGVVGCGKGGDSSAETSAADAVIAIDGSSTVFPITEAVAEEFQKQSGARVTIGVSGTGGGFKKFCAGETQLSGASRPIKPSEVEACQKAGISYVELPVAFDGIAVVVNPANDWAPTLTVEELAAMWKPEAQGKVGKWSDVRSDWPEQDLHLFGPGVDSGTYDYFTAAIVGKEHSSRGDFTSSEDDNVLVNGVANDKLALGFFGYAYYAENKDKLKLVGVDDKNGDNGAGPIQPSPTTVADGTYQPLSRPIFVYVSVKAAESESVKAFVDFYLTHAPALVTEVGYIPLPDKAYELARARFDKRTPGSVFAGGSKVGVKVEDLLAE
jgi:phosphate transport system substrate-binding protein